MCSHQGRLQVRTVAPYHLSLLALPPIDAFVNHFFGTVNYRYNSVYAPTFTDQYVQWWSDRTRGRNLSPEFTCLLLRICAYSGQYLPPELQIMVQFELACTPQSLTDRLAEAADQLSASFAPSHPCLERVQEQFLKCAWLKSESRMVETWHVLGRAIREAQELGFDKDTGLDSLTEFEIEIRRRVWALLYIWDWLVDLLFRMSPADLLRQMSAWLGRPHLIDQTNHSFTLPNLRLETDSTKPNLVSPFAHISLQAELARRITPHKLDQSMSNLTVDQIFAIESECEKFIQNLPPIFRIESPDLSLDEQHQYFVGQRYQLHVVTYMTMFDFLKLYLTRSPKNPKSARDTELRHLAIDICFKLVNASRRLFDHEFPINAKWHLVIFSIFDTAAVLCSAIIHDVDNVLPHREQIMNAIEGSLDLLHQLSLTRIGAASYKFLFNLVEASAVLSRWFARRKRPRLEMTTSAPEPHSAQVPQSIPTDTAGPSTNLELNPAPSISDDGGLAFDMEQFLAQNPLGEASQFDMGGLEEIWDWDSLNLDAFLNPNPNNNSNI